MTSTTAVKSKSVLVIRYMDYAMIYGATVVLK